MPCTLWYSWHVPLTSHLSSLWPRWTGEAYVYSISAIQLLSLQDLFHANLNSLM